MKKITALCLIAVLVMSLFGGCANNKTDTDNQKEESLNKESVSVETPTNTQPITVREIHSGDSLTVSGTLVEESYEYENIDGVNIGTAYILNLDEPINVALYDDFAELNGDKKTIDSVQVLSYDGVSELVGKHLTVMGNVMVWHTQYHIRTIVLTDCEVTE